MRRFVNLYIVLFLIDAGLSLQDELLTFFSAPVPTLSGLRFLIAFLVILLSLLVYPVMGIDRRLPKRVLLPLTLYVFWGAMALWPLQGMIARDHFAVMAAFGQVFIGGIAVITLRNFYGNGSILLPEEHFTGPLFNWRNTLTFFTVNLLLLPIFAVYFLMASAGVYLDQSTAGFMRLSPVGLYTAERSYHHGTKSVRLAAMMHIGREGYYQELVDSLPAEKTVILAEGVTDRDGLLKGQFHYGKLAGLVGLSSQESMHLDGNLIDLADLDSPAENSKDDATRPDIVRADLDISSFKPGTIEFLNLLGRTLLGTKPFVQAFEEYSGWIKSHQNPELYSAVMKDILDKRNQIAIDSFQRSLKRYDTIVIPWGAMHMPAIEAAVLKQSFVRDGERERLVVDFRALPYGKLLETLQ